MIFLSLWIYAADLVPAAIKSYMPNLAKISVVGILSMNLVTGVTGTTPATNNCNYRGAEGVRCNIDYPTDDVIQCSSCPEGQYGFKLDTTDYLEYCCDKDHTGVIIAAVFGSIAGVVLICCVLCCCYKKYRGCCCGEGTPHRPPNVYNPAPQDNLLRKIGNLNDGTPIYA